MTSRSKKLLAAAVLTGVLTVVFFLALSARFFHRHPVDWITAEAPTRAVIGRPFELRAALKDIPQPGELLADLHRVTREGRSQGRMSSGGSFPAAAGGTYQFTMRVKPDEGLEYVGVVIFLTPTGRWADRVLAVSSGPIPVKPDEPGAKPAPTKRLRLFWSGFHEAKPNGPESFGQTRGRTAPPTNAEAPEGPRGRPVPPDHGRDTAERTPLRTRTTVRIVLFALLFSGGLLSLLLSTRPGAGEPGDRARPQGPWLAFGVILLLSSVVELFLVDEMITEWGRRMALQSNLYFVRRPFQMLLISVVAAAGACYFLFSLITALKRRSVSPAKLAGLGIMLYLAVSFVEMLSFHYVDRWKDRLVLGVSVIDLFKGAAAVAVLAVVLWALLGKPRARPAEGGDASGPPPRS